MYKYIFFGVISVGRQKNSQIKVLGIWKYLKEQMFLWVLIPRLQKDNINFCLISQLNSDAWNQPLWKTFKPTRYLSYSSILPECLDPNVQILQKHPFPLISS